ncbi:MAG TPA: hypothetical protein DCE41_30925 [Cytophagales bacterium]|nr:hypothetical protein [Cytophagales bacterium]HAA20496.1 hypothetical protein [Cytophagales bacterium]HAP59054.1 hypothetical protein [Cytophagales bacterium]
MITFQWIDLLLIPGILQGLLLALVLRNIHRGNVSANKVLSGILFLSAAMLAGRLLFFRIPSHWMNQLTLIPDMVIFLFGPLIWWYTRRALFHTEGKRERLHPIHFLPALAFGIFVVYTFTMSKAEYNWRLTNWMFYWHFMVISFTGIALNLAYISHCFVLLRRYKNQEKKHLSSPQKVSFLVYFLGALGVCVLIWTASTINEYVFHSWSKIVNYNTIWVVLSLAVYVVGYFSLKQPELFRLPANREVPLGTEESKATAKGVDRIKPTRQAELKEALEELMKEKRVYRTNDLTLQDLSEMLSESTNNVSWLLNEVYQQNFYAFVNGFRIREFLDKVAAGEHETKTVLGMAIEVGFNTKSTFNKAFRQEMGDTPSQYIKARTQPLASAV